MVDLALTVAMLCAGLSLLVLLLLLLRRRLLAAQRKKTQEAEQRLQPLALELTEGHSPQAELDEQEVVVLAALLGRYARLLSGDPRAHIATFFERHHYVQREIARLSDRRSWVRASAAFTLGDMGSARTVPALIEALEDNALEVRAAAARSLGKIASPQAVEPLVRTLTQRQVPRAAAAQALLNLGSRAREPLRALLGHSDSELRASVLQLLGLVGEAQDARRLIALLEDSAAPVRVAAAGALGRLGASEAEHALVQRLKDRVATVRAASAEALAALGSPDSGKALAQALAQEADFETARAMSESLVALNPRQVAQMAQRHPQLEEAWRREQLAA